MDLLIVKLVRKYCSVIIREIIENVKLTVIMNDHATTKSACKQSSYQFSWSGINYILFMNESLFSGLIAINIQKLLVIVRKLFVWSINQCVLPAHAQLRENYCILHLKNF